MLLNVDPKAVNSHDEMNRMSKMNGGTHSRRRCSDILLVAQARLETPRESSNYRLAAMLSGYNSTGGST